MKWSPGWTNIIKNSSWFGLVCLRLSSSHLYLRNSLWQKLRVDYSQPAITRITYNMYDITVSRLLKTFIACFHSDTHQRCGNNYMFNYSAMELLSDGLTSKQMLLFTKYSPPLGYYLGSPHYWKRLGSSSLAVHQIMNFMH